MTFTHEGNKTYLDGLVNFEKMHMLAPVSYTHLFTADSFIGNSLIVNIVLIIAFFYGNYVFLHSLNIIFSTLLTDCFIRYAC